MVGASQRKGVFPAIAAAVPTREKTMEMRWKPVLARYYWSEQLCGESTAEKAQMPREKAGATGLRQDGAKLA
ncbi:hypothetical protein [Pseudomonas putida]|uniref:hypothetical protein n=1 Tax=Pseudomonas putida TaxID=303 RepID=UPI000951EAC4|nr:hypothetical protein [Pseudomonas putida]